VAVRSRVARPRSTWDLPAVIPGPTDGQMWIWSEPCAEAVCTAPALAQTNGTVRLVDAAGHQIGAPIHSPWTPIGSRRVRASVPALCWPWRTVPARVIRLRSGIHAPTLPQGSSQLSACRFWRLDRYRKHERLPSALLDSAQRRPIGQVAGSFVAPRSNCFGSGAISPDGGRIALLGTFHGRRGECHPLSS